MDVKKLAGVGLVNLLVIWLFVVLVTVGSKSLAGQYPDNPISKIILAV
jgi:hypothetical protein